jgi:CobQ-like glutamine amidotransferase family enzyme
VKIRIGHLYPEYLNIYADRGNIAVFARRAGLRGHELEVAPISVGDEVRPGEHDLLYIGGGQDREQALIAPDLAAKGPGIHEAVARGAAVLAVCGGYQLFGRGYRGHQGDPMPGIGLFQHETVAGEGRMIGDVLLDCEWAGETLAGFENHAGRTYLGEGTAPLGRVIEGHGNNGRDGTEGVRGGAHGTVVGTYMHGPLLPKNTAFADWLARTALGLDALPPLDDALEDAAHGEAARAAGVGP